LIILYIFAVENRNGDIEYYQVSDTVNDEKTFEREFSSLRTLRDSYPKYILTLDYDNAIIDGIQKINVIDWLLNK
jgi:predicted AAA+ superfamily ATPase